MKRSSHVIRVRGRWRFPLSVAAGVTRAGHGRAAAQLSKQTWVSCVGGAPAWHGRVAAEVWTGQVRIGHAGGTLAEHRRMPAHCHGRGVRWRTAESLLSGSMIKIGRYHRAINVLAKFENDPWKFTDVRVLMVIFHVRSWKMRKKIAKILPIFFFFGDYDKTRNLYWLKSIDLPMYQIWWL